jgi:AmmeMemoRadiSam system protein B
VAFRGLAAPTARAFATPLGELELDRAALAGLVAEGLAQFHDEPHAREHSIEVELPFVQRALGAAASSLSLVPLVVGDASPAEVARALSALARPGTVLVVSSDLSHYHPYDEGRRIDERTVARALDLADDLEPEEACGARPWSGLARFAAERGLAPRLVELSSSGDTAGDRARVVGYAGLVYEQRAEPQAARAAQAAQRGGAS